MRVLALMLALSGPSVPTNTIPQDRIWIENLNPLPIEIPEAPDWTTCMVMQGCAQRLLLKA